MKRIETFVEINRLTPPSQQLRLPASHFTQEEQDLLRDFDAHGGMVLLNTGVGWWRFLVVYADNHRFEFKSYGAPGE